MLDRFGEVPKSVLNVMYVSYLKSLSTKLGIIKIVERLSSSVFKFNPDNKEILQLVGNLPDEIFRKIEFNFNEDCEMILNYNNNKLFESIELVKMLYELKI